MGQKNFDLKGKETPSLIDDRGGTIAAPGLTGKGTSYFPDKGTSESFMASFKAASQAEARGPGEPFLTAIEANDGIIDQFIEVDDLPRRPEYPKDFTFSLKERAPSLFVNYQLEPGWGAVALAFHEKGHPTWHLPTSPTFERQHEGTLSFAVPHVQHDDFGMLGPLGRIGRKLVSIIKFPLLEGARDYLIGRILAHGESRFVKERLFEIDPETSDERPAEPGGGRARLRTAKELKTLLFLHGTISSTRGAFKGLLEDPAFRSVMRRYDVVLGYDHKTLSKSPGQNAAEVTGVLEAYLQGTSCEMNILSHSRGGLVGRSLLETSAGKLGAKKLIMYGTPNDGTPLACGKNIVKFLNGLQMLTSAADLASGPVSATFSLLKLFAHGIWNAPGLRAQSPNSSFLKQLNSPPNVSVDYFFARANFKPDPYLAQVVHWTATQALMDGRASDLIVPFDSVDKTSPNQSIQLLHEFADGIVHHNNFFFQPQTLAELGRAL